MTKTSPHSVDTWTRVVLAPSQRNAALTPNVSKTNEVIKSASAKRDSWGKHPSADRNVNSTRTALRDTSASMTTELDTQLAPRNAAPDSAVRTQIAQRIQRNKEDLQNASVLRDSSEIRWSSVKTFPFILTETARLTLTVESN